MNGKNAGGSIMTNLGVKGIVYWELESKGGDWSGPGRHEIHGSYKVIVDAHAPDEYMLIEPAEGSELSGLDEVEKYCVDLVYALAGR